MSDVFDEFVEKCRRDLQSGAMKDPIGNRAAWVDLVTTNRLARFHLKQAWRIERRNIDEINQLKSQLAKVAEIARELAGFYGDRETWVWDECANQLIVSGDVEQLINPSSDYGLTEGYGGKLARAKLKEMEEYENTSK